MNIKERHEEIIDALHEGDFVGPIEKFYAEDVVAQANDNAPTTGRDTIAAAEREYVEGVTAFHGIQVHATATRSFCIGSVEAQRLRSATLEDSKPRRYARHVNFRT